MTFNLDIYLSGRVQKLYKIKPADMGKEADTSLSSDWWSVWRCEHLASDKDRAIAWLGHSGYGVAFVIIFSDLLLLSR
jgi:hypothetical protein